MKVSEMEDKTKEKHADYLMKFSNNLNTAFFVTLLIAPLGLIAQQIMGSPETFDASIINAISILGSWQGVTFLALEALVFFLAGKSQDRALQIYNQLYKPKHNKVFKYVPAAKRAASTWRLRYRFGAL